MEYLICDVETTTHAKGNAFSKRNKLIMVGLRHKDKSLIYSEFSDSVVKDIQSRINNCDVLVGFNIKFDIHWLMNIGVTFDNVKQIWDCQIAEFLLESQNNKYPSLNEALDKYGLPRKLDVVKTEFWNKGINTDEIPKDILREYLEGDLLGTEEVFKRQAKQFGVLI